MRLVVNGADVEVDDRHAKTPLLWVLRGVLELRGTKFGCGGGYCAACTVLGDGRNTKSCQTATAIAALTPARESASFQSTTQSRSPRRGPMAEVTITPSENGPYFISGPVTITAPDGRVIEHPDPRTQPVFANLVRYPMAADPAAAPAAALAFSASPRTANAAKRRSPGSITVQRSHDLTTAQVDNTGAFDDQRND
jgi:hypothetical protein